MRTKSIGCLLRVAHRSGLAGLVALTGCGGEGDAEMLGAVGNEIQKGVAVSPDWVGTPTTAGCSGVLVRPDWALTALHCFPTVGGTIAFEGGQQTTIQRITKYPAPSPAVELYVDLQILKLAAPFSPTLGPFGLFRGPASALAGASVHALGWGYNNVNCHWHNGWMNCTGPGTLRGAILPVTAAPEAANPGYFLVGVNASQQIQQGGDSGGPAILANANANKHKVVGTFGAGDGDTFGRIVSSHRMRDWVNGLSGSAPALGDHAGFEKSDTTDSVVYRNGATLRQASNATGTWVTTTLPTTNLGSNPALFVYPDGSSSAVYRDTGNLVRETYHSPGGAWRQGNVSAATTGEPLAGGDPASYVRADGYSAIVYRSTANRIQELTWKTGMAQWAWADLNNTPSATIAASDPVPYIRLQVAPDGTSFAVSSVVYRDTAGDVCELSKSFASFDGDIYEDPSPWTFRKLTNPTSNAVVPALAVGKPRPYSGSDELSGVVYRAANGHIWLLNRPITGGAPWAGSLTTSLNLVAAAADPVTYVQANGRQAIVWLGTDGDIYHMELSGQSLPWFATNLSVAVAGANVAVSTSHDPPVNAYVRSDRASAVTFRKTDGTVIELSKPWGSANWSMQTLGN